MFQEETLARMEINCGRRDMSVLGAWTASKGNSLLTSVRPTAQAVEDRSSSSDSTKLSRRGWFASTLECGGKSGWEE